MSSSSPPSWDKFRRFAGNNDAQADIVRGNADPLPSRDKTTAGKFPLVKDYTVGWIAALHIELASALVMLDDVYDTPSDFEQPDRDTNSYSYGSIRKHNVVIASLPVGSGYTVSAATTTQFLISAFPRVKFCLLVGIGGAIPSPSCDIRLGDIAVGGQGFFQYDHGKAENNDVWVSKSDITRPPEVLLKALAKLLALHEQAKFGFLEIWNKAKKDNELWSKKFDYPKEARDRLFESDYSHNDNHLDCSHCTQWKVKIRPTRESKDPQIHNGLIASGNSVVKNSHLRDQIGSQRPNTICLEMEAAGLSGNPDCLVIRGICDYADSHKNDDWQRYASAIAAALAKELLRWVKPSGTSAVRNPTYNIETTEEPTESVEAQFLRELDPPAYLAHLNDIPQAEDGTGSWYTNHEYANTWWYSKSPFECIWVTAAEAYGKSVLVRHLMDTVLPNPVTNCYFLFKAGARRRETIEDAMRAILHQLLTQNPAIAKHMGELGFLQREIPTGAFSFENLWVLFDIAIRAEGAGRIVCLLDGFDECQDERRVELLNSIADLQNQTNSSTWIKFLITSRSTQAMQFAIHYYRTQLDPDQGTHFQHLRGDDEENVELIEKEVSVVIDARLDEICRERHLSNLDKEMLQRGLDRVPKSSFLWVNKLLNAIQFKPGDPYVVLEETYQQCFSEAMLPKGAPSRPNKAFGTRIIPKKNIPWT